MTAVAVDLAAVARARTELAALVVAHPFLTSPEAHARLAAALPALVEPSMSKSLDPNHVPGTGASQTVGVRLTPKLLDAVKVETERLRSMAPGTSFGLGDGVRSLLLRALSTDPAKAVNAAPVPAETPLAASPSMPPRRATQPPARASVRPPLPSVPPPPRVPTELLNDAETVTPSPQLALIPEPPHAPTLSASKVRVRLAAINATGVGVRAIGEAAGVSKSSVHNFLHGGDVTPDALDALARYVETHQPTGKTTT